MKKAEAEEDKYYLAEENAKKLIEKIGDIDQYTLLIVGRNGSGKTTTVKTIAKHYGANKIYTVNGNKQNSELDLYNQDEYREGLFSRLMSTGESLYHEVSQLMHTEDGVLIMDEPTANLDIINSSMIVEAFARHFAKIKILATNDMHSLKILYSLGLRDAYNAETGNRQGLAEYINSMVDETIEALRGSPFQQIDYKMYENLKINKGE